MQQDDINELTDEEREVLADSFDKGAETRRWRSVLWSTGLLLIAVILATTSGFGVPLLGILAASVLLVAGVEKISYGRKMAHHESLTRKLVHRIERLEGRTLTPSQADPARALRPTRSERGVREPGSAAIREGTR